MNKSEVIDSLRSLHDLSKAINSTLDIDEVVEEVLLKTSALMDSEEVMIALLENEKRVLTVHSYLSPGSREPQVKVFDRVKSFDHCLVHKGRVITMKEIVPKEDYDLYIEKMPQLADMVFAPLEIKGEAYGLIGILNGKKKFSTMKLEIFCSLGSQAAVAMENANLYKRLKLGFFHTAEALAEAINSRDPYTGGHARRVKDYSELIALALEMDEVEREKLSLASILHDIGKIGIDDAILRKGGALSAKEKLIMKEHPVIGAKILGHIEEMSEVIKGVCFHHERFDGAGYPEGLKGEEIPLYARIIAVADAYDALTTDRPYRKAIDKGAACEKLKKAAGTHFDPALVGPLCRQVL